MARTRASISALVPSTSSLGSVSAGSCNTSAGKSHSWLRPTSRPRAPSAHTISVALAIRLTMRLLPLPACGERVKSQNTKPSRVTVSPTRTAMGERNMGPAQAKVWNSPFSAQGSTPEGNSASRAASKRRPAKLSGSLLGSTQAT